MPYPIGEILKSRPHRRPQQRARAQSFLELALVLPVLLIILLGLVEVAIFIGRYLDVLDLTREVARQAAREERFSDEDALRDAFFNETFSYLAPPPTGLNSYIAIDPAVDDVVISVFDLRGSGEWIMRNLTTTNENYKKDCDGNSVRAQPHFTLGNVISVGSPPANEGMIAVEVFFCHELALNLPIFSSFIPNPVQIHAFTIFPFPAVKYR